MHSTVLLLALTSLGAAVVAGASDTTSGRELQVAKGKGCVCTAVYKPVCGAKDGVRKTYPNACEARCNGAAVVEQEACSGDASTQPVGAAGGRKLAAAAMCICPALYKPVCGANGKTYSNNCKADCKGVAAQCWGKCPCPRCICTAQYAPVCGVDNVTYGNCLGSEGDTCGGIAGKGCEEGLTCVAPATPDAQGVCKTAPAPADGTLGGKCGGIAGMPCDRGLACVTPPGTADAFGTCQQDSPLVGKGESCGGYRVGPSPVCAAGLYCKTDPHIADIPGVCTPNPRSGAGGPCGGFPPPDMPLPTCKPGLTCKTDSNVPDKPGVCQ